MHFNDMTLDGLMKEFQNLTQADDTSNDTYVLPKDLLDNSTSVSEVPYYEEILKSTAADRDKFYDAMKDSKIIDEAHPQGSTKLEGLNGQDATVEDLHALRDGFEKILSEKVKAKSAALAQKLIVLADRLDTAGYVHLATLVDRQLKKLSETIEPTPELAGGFDQVGAVTAFNETIDEILRQIEYRHYGQLTSQQQKQFVFIKANATSYIKSLYESVQKGDLKTAAQIYDLFKTNINPFFMAVSSLDQMVGPTREFVNAFANLAKALGIRTGGEHNKTGVAAQITKIINMFDSKLKTLYGDQYQGTPHTWQGLDATLRKYFQLYPSNATDIPTEGRTYSNWTQLEKHVAFALAELEHNMQAPNAGEQNKTAPAAGTFQVPEKGPPVSPDLPPRPSNEGPKIRTPNNYMNPN